MISTVTANPRRRSKSIPAPGTKLLIAATMSATRSWPAARMPATTWSCVSPAGMFRVKNPVKITSVARPSTRGAHTASTTDAAPMRVTTIIATL